MKEERGPDVSEADLEAKKAADEAAKKAAEEKERRKAFKSHVLSK